MAFRLIKRDSVTVPVKGFLQGTDGKPERFSFDLICRRLGDEGLRTVMRQPDRPVSDVMCELTEGWRGVLDADGNDLSFNLAGLRELMDTPGVAALAWNAFLSEQGAKEKN